MKMEQSSNPYIGMSYLYMYIGHLKSRNHDSREVKLLIDNNVVHYSFISMTCLKFFIHICILYHLAYVFKPPLTDSFSY